MSTHTIRDSFFWLGQINKASAVINTSEGLLDASVAPRICRGIQSVLDAGKSCGARPCKVIDFEPVLISEAGVEATLLHAGRSSQDMHMTASTAQLRQETLTLATQLCTLVSCLVGMAEAHAETLVPNYTNGVAAQPNSYGHYLLGHAAGFMRDAERLQEFYARLDLSPMGTSVLNGSGWPLNRARMASYLGFGAIVDNAYDAVQIRNAELPIEMGCLATNIALHVGTFIQDTMAQYSQPRPWILLREGGSNTYVSSAMPQKRNPGLLNNTRAQASRVVSLGVGRTIQAHNVPSGMPDARSVGDNVAVLKGTTGLLLDLCKVLEALEINADRALEELNLDWTASQELADVLMLNHGVPFRVGHHFASEMVSFAKRENIKPSDFPYADAKRLYSDVCDAMLFSPQGSSQAGVLPLGEADFRAALDPVSMVRNRKTCGGPQPAEMQRMIDTDKRAIGAFEKWVQGKRAVIDEALARLDADFSKLLEL